MVLHLVERVMLAEDIHTEGCNAGGALYQSYQMVVLEVHMQVIGAI